MNSDLKAATESVVYREQALPALTNIQRRRQARQRLFAPQQRTNPKFMSRTQREAFKQGKEIWV